MNASPADQQTLLALADIDRRAAHAEQVRRNPPQAARVSALIAERQGQTHELTVRMGVAEGIETEIKRIESDIDVARTRQQRDRDRLPTTIDPKAAIGLQNEIASLANRLNELEDAQLEAMERLEEAHASVASQQQVIAATNTEGAALSAEAKQVVADATATIDALVRDREAIAGSVPAALLALYDKLAERTAGAALFQHNMCQGCRMVLAGSDLADVRAAAEDAVIFCPECGCILVRTSESGL